MAGRVKDSYSTIINMDIFVVRHTEYDNPQDIYPGRLPLALSTTGRDHAQRIGQWFAKNKFLKLPIYSSPVARTLQTAEIIACVIGSKVEIDERLTEIWYSWAGEPITDTLGSNEYYARPNQEKPADILNRIKQVFQEKLNNNENCIIVTHGDPATYLYHDVKYGRPPGKETVHKEYVQLGEIVCYQFAQKKLTVVERITV